MILENLVLLRDEHLHTSGWNVSGGERFRPYRIQTLVFFSRWRQRTCADAGEKIAELTDSSQFCSVTYSSRLFCHVSVHLLDFLRVLCRHLLRARKRETLVFFSAKVAWAWRTASVWNPCSGSWWCARARAAWFCMCVRACVLICVHVSCKLDLSAAFQTAI